MSFEVPKKLGKYEIVRQLGQGAMGIVYEGIDAKLRRPCAIKLIRKDQLDPADAEEYSRRFLTEAQAAAKLDHANIVKVFDYDDEEELAYIVMELVRGGKTLKNYFDAKHTFSMVHTVRLMSELLSALAHSHSREVFHRDIKPDNIFVTEAGAVKLGDFGIAKIDTSHKTMAGTVLGTPGYMSPEQFRGEEADGRSDLYSAGVILYQFLVGERPFTGPFLSLQKKVLNDLPRPPSALRPAVSTAIDEVVLKALEKRAEDRFQTAGEFIHALAASMGLAENDDDSEATMVAAPRLPPLQRPAGGAAEATVTRGGPALATGTRAGLLAAAPAPASARVDQGEITVPMIDLLPPAAPTSAPRESAPAMPAPATNEDVAPGSRRRSIGISAAVVAIALAALAGGYAWFATPQAAAPVAVAPVAVAPAAPVAVAPAVIAPAAPPPNMETMSVGSAPGPAATPSRAPADAPSATPRQPEAARPREHSAAQTAREPPPPAQSSQPIPNKKLPSARCADIIQLVSLGEPLSEAEKTFLKLECRP